jgi:hypothetical protein
MLRYVCGVFYHSSLTFLSQLLIIITTGMGGFEYICTFFQSAIANLIVNFPSFLKVLSNESIRDIRF